MISHVLIQVRGRGGSAGLALIALFFMLSAGLPASAAEKLVKLEAKKERPAVFEVPTTGKILDVQYRPEFDEWWVTCREGENITIYSYDKRTQRWGRATFTPRGAAARASRSEAKDRDKPVSVEEIEEASMTAKPYETEKGEGPVPDNGKAAAKDTKPDTKRWWDPLNLIKQGGEKLIQPFQ